MPSYNRQSDVLLLPQPPAEPYLPAEGLVTCSICLRVQRGSGWIEAVEAIRLLRSYDLSELVHLQPALCDQCRATIAERRGQVPELALAEAA
jgi:hypothetical protein